MEESFFINEFFIDPSRNLVRAEKTGIETHLEPRVLELLCILSSRPGVMIERNYFVQEVWNNYAGGDEALTQAISFLRKVFNDKNRKLIETIPKKGYLLTGKVTNVSNSKFPDQFGKLRKSRDYWLILPFIALLIISYLVLRPKRMVSIKPPTLIKKTPTVSKKIPTIY